MSIRLKIAYHNNFQAVLTYFIDCDVSMLIFIRFQILCGLILVERNQTAYLIDIADRISLAFTMHCNWHSSKTHVKMHDELK